jgi:hypothetical protein
VFQDRNHNGKRGSKYGNYEKIKIKGLLVVRATWRVTETISPEISLLRPEPVKVDVGGVGVQGVVDLQGRYVLQNLQEECLAHGLVVVSPDGEPAHKLPVPLLDVCPARYFGLDREGSEYLLPLDGVAKTG